MKDELNFVAPSSMTLPHKVYRMQLEKLVKSTGVHRQSGIPEACTTPQRGQLDDCRPCKRPVQHAISVAQQ
jgi:hypothetical protein